MSDQDPSKSQHLKTLLTHPELHASRTVPLFKVEGEAPKSWLEKALSLFADVRAGEGFVVVLMTLNVFLLLGAYYLLKVVRDTIMLSDHEAELKTYSAAYQALVLLMLVPVYGWVGTLVNRVKLVAGLTAFFMSHLLIFWYLYSVGVHVDVAFYIWVGVFNLFVVSQFWAFANDIYTEGQGRRLFPMIMVGASVGALLGSGSAKQFFSSRLAPHVSMLIAFGILALTIAIIVWINTRESKKADEISAREAVEPLSMDGAFELIRTDRYLFWIAVLTILLNLVNTSGQYLMDRLIKEQAEALALVGPDRTRFIGETLGSYYTWVNALALALQAFAVSRIFRHAGVRGAMFFLPVLGVMSYSVLAVAPVLAIVRVVKILENATDYSLQNTVRQAFWLPTSREAKYKAKAAVDTFCSRLGDVSSAGVVYAGKQLALTVSGFAWVLVGFTATWLWVATQIAREHRKRTL